MKNKDIYELLNDINLDESEFVEMNVNDIEKAKFKKNLKKSVNRKTKYLNGLKVASVAVLSIGVLATTDLGGHVFANVNEFFYDIATSLGIKKDLKDYKTEVLQTVTRNGFTVSLNEVVLDKDQLIITSSFKSKNKIEAGYIAPKAKVSINGKVIESTGDGTCVGVDDNTVESMIFYKIDEKLTGDVKISVEYTDLEYLKDGKEETLKGPWAFEFNTQAKVADTTKEININKEIKLKNGQTITLDKYTSNVMGQEITYTKEKKELGYYLQLKGTDNLGNEVVFSLNQSSDDKGTFEFDKFNMDFPENAKELKLTVYGDKNPEDGKQFKGKYEKLSDEFTINISK